MKFQCELQKLLQIKRKIARVYVITGCDNQKAQNLYKKALNVEQKGGLIGALYGENDYSPEEIVMANMKMEIPIDLLCKEYKSLLPLD
jgi:hypothetical protein